jgi:hypothetical protein
MIHKGVEFTLRPTVEPDIWQWRFDIAGVAKTGKTHTRLVHLATRRVQFKIENALRAHALKLGLA